MINHGSMHKSKFGFSYSCHVLHVLLLGYDDIELELVDAIDWSVCGATYSKGCFVGLHKELVHVW